MAGLPNQTPKSEKSSPAMSAARKIAEFSTRLQTQALTPELYRQCGRAFADTFACAIAGQHEAAPMAALRYLETAHGPLETASASPSHPARLVAGLWGRQEFAPLEAAALWNGIAGHVLDYDDVTSPMRGHPSIALLPSIVALADATDASGKELACAYVAGFEVICKLSRAMAVKHYARGWHSTSSIGTIGAAVACAVLLKLNVEQTICAIGLAVAQAAGTRANFGTDAKSFHAGQCNAAALRAALLAQQGFTASEHALDGQFGYVELYANAESLAEELDLLGVDGQYELLRAGLEIKKYPLCYATHRALDGLLDLKSELGLTLQNVKAIHVRTSASALTPLIHARPRTGLEAKFSMEYALAAALADGSVGLPAFKDAAVQRPALQAFFPRVTADDTLTEQVFPRWTNLTVTLTDGQVIERRIDTLRGSVQAPISDAALQEKVTDCLLWGRSELDASALMTRSLDLAHVKVRALIRQ